MISDIRYRRLRSDINRSIMDMEFMDGKYVTTIYGISTVVEMIVKNASLYSNIPMDWHYSGGAANVYTLGEVDASLAALKLSFPKIKMEEE